MKLINDELLISYRFKKMSDFRFLLFIDNWFDIVVRKENDKYYISDYSGYDKISKEIKDLQHLKNLVFNLSGKRLNIIN